MAGSSKRIMSYLRHESFILFFFVPIDFVTEFICQSCEEDDIFRWVAAIAIGMKEISLSSLVFHLSSLISLLETF